jgi:glutamate carboxypeptidase
MTPMNRAEYFLKRLVDCPSPTTNQSQVRTTHSLLAEELLGLGFGIQWLRDPSGKTDDLLVAEKPAVIGPLVPHRFITFVSHIDTVLSPAESGPLRVDSKGRLLGAGIIDNKGGLAVLLESLRLFLSENPNHLLGLRVVSSPDEENGSSAWHSIYREIGKESVAVLGFEPALEDGSIITSRRGNRWYDVHLMGIEAHAGRCRGEELNAAHESALMISDLLSSTHRLQKQFPCSPGLGVSLHVGHIEGGRNRHNVVCGKVDLKIDTRFSTFEQRDQLHQEVIRIIERKYQTNAKGEQISRSWQIVDDCPPFFSGSENASAQMVDLLLREIKSCEPQANVQAFQAGGAGDVNHMSRPGLLILDGLGPIGGKMHTTEEYLVRESLDSRSRALANWYPALIRQLSSATLENQI